jgi:hypothetical protein
MGVFRSDSSSDTPETRFTYRNGPGKAEDLKEGLRVICLGKATGGK